MADSGITTKTTTSAPRIGTMLQQDVDRHDPDEHQRRLHRVEADELVLLLHEQEDDAGHEADQIAERRRHVGVEAGRRFLSVQRAISPASRSAATKRARASLCSSTQKV